MTAWRSRVDVGDDTFSRRRAGMLDLVDRMRALEDRAAVASSESDERFARRGQLTPRERLAHLLDPGAPWLELGNLHGYRRDVDDRDATVPGAGQLAGIGFVSGTRCAVLVTDAGIAAGAISHAGGEKIVRMQQVALDNRLPFLHLVESAGANLLTYRVEQFVEGGRVFANLARLSAAGIPVITVLHGSSTAGGAYMPGLSDVVIGVRDNGKAFLAGPPLLRAATGEVADAEELGGAAMHATTTGLVDHLAADDVRAIATCREVVARLHWGDGRLPAAPTDFDDPVADVDELAGVVPLDHATAHDVREVMARVVDGSDITEFKADHGPGTVCVEATVHGFPVAMVGNNGPIDNAGATKATHFVQHCCHVGTPIAWLQDTTGYMVGVASEQGGMIKHGSKMIQAVATASVPQFTFMVGASFGAGNYGMAGRGFDPRFVFSWPNARTGVMGAEQAATTMRIVAEERARRKNEEVDEEGLAQLREHLVTLFDDQADAFTTSGLGLDDGVIDPRDTRRVLAFLLATVAEADTVQLRPLDFAVARP